MSFRKLELSTHTDTEKPLLDKKIFVLKVLDCFAYAYPVKQWILVKQIGLEIDKMLLKLLLNAKSFVKVLLK